MPKRARLLALLGLIALLVAGGGVLWWRGREPAPDAAYARAALARSIRLFGQGNATAARSWALKATRADPQWGLAQALLARSYLALGEGVAAEGALMRARAIGFDPARGRQLEAEAALLQGDPERALKLAAQAGPRYSAYAMRVAARALADLGDLPGAQAMLAQVLAASEGRNARAWIDLGRVRYRTGDVGGAIVAAGRALALNPRDADALALRAELMRGQYGLIAALPWYEAALKVDPWRHDVLIGYAATLGDAGRYRAMLDATRRAQAARPGSAPALYLQAVLAARAGNNDLARALLQRSGNGLDGQPGPLLLAGILDYDAGGYQQAIEKWRAVLARAPMNLAARRLLGAALYQGGDAQAALGVLRPLALRGDADSYTLTLVGRAFEARGERDWAARFLDRAAIPARTAALQFGTDDDLGALAAAAARTPGNPIVEVEYLRGLLFRGARGEALDRAQDLARRYPGVPQAQLLVGDVLMTLGRPAPAAQAYARAADLRFDEATLLRAVEALEASGQRDKAAVTTALFLAQHPMNVSARRLTGHWQIAAGQWDDAIETLEELRAELGNRDAALLAELALAYAGADEDQVAERYAAAAYDLAPMNAAVVDAYGWVLHQGGATGAAAELLRKAVALAPGHPALRDHLATVEAALARGRTAALRPSNSTLRQI